MNQIQEGTSIEQEKSKMKSTERSPDISINFIKKLLEQEKDIHEGSSVVNSLMNLRMRKTSLMESAR